MPNMPARRPAFRPSRLPFLAALALAATVSPLGLHGAQAQEDKANWLDKITVVGTRTAVSVRDNPRSVTVVSREEIERSGTDSIAELLRDVPGVTVADDSVAGMKRLRIRGESSRRVTILVDGQEITDHSTFGTPLLIDPASVESIEVVRGPSSVLFGAKAIGGVINIVTRKGADKPLQAEAGASYLSGSKGWQSWAAVSGSRNGFDYRLSASVDRHGDRVVPKGRYSATGELADSSYSSNSLYGHLGYRFGEADNHYLALKLEQHRLESEGWPGEAAASYQDFKIDLPRRDRRKIGLSYEGDEISDIVAKVRADVFYQTVDRTFINRVRSVSGPTSVAVNTTSDDKITDYGFNAQVDLDLLAGHHTIAGVQYLSDRLNTAKTAATARSGFPVPSLNGTSFSTSRDKAHIDTFSLYGQDEWNITDTLTLSAGARLYHTRTELDETTVAARAGFGGESDTRLLSSLGASWEALENTTLRASYSEGYITPTLLQLYSSTTAGGQTTYGNPDLEAELSRNFEIGGRYEAGGLALDAAAFYSKARNYITTQRCVAVTAYCQTVGTSATPSSLYVNADKATSFGLELQAQYDVGDTGFSPYVSGAWIRRELQMATWSTYDSDTPALSGRLGVKYEGEALDMPVWADLFLRGAVANRQTYLSGSSLVTERLPGWGTLNLAFGGTYGKDGRVVYSLQFNNILNKEYRPSFGELPGYGRSIEASLRVKF